MDIIDERYFKCFYHYENIPKIMFKSMKKWFMKNRQEAVDIFREHIGLVNNEWRLTSKPFTFGEYLEDINPEYIMFVQNKIQPHLDLFNKHFMLYEYKIDEYGDLVGHVKLLKNSKLWITLKEIELA